ncbi:MAG TPA: sulfotransferase [Myxococcota bacterium]|nr:sulfotransferase [Myxococcota bacterium]
MSLEIIGTGFGRTGTLSLKLALEQLGFGRCYHMMEVSQNPGHAALWSAAYDEVQRERTSQAAQRRDAAQAARSEPQASEARTDWDALYAGYRATVDWPSAEFWRQLVDRYPNAKVIHTERPSAAWFKSASSTIFRTMTLGAPPGTPAAFAEQLEMARQLILHGRFGGRLDDEAHAIAIYEAHNARVKREIPAARLLVYEPGQGWAPLCKFLGVGIPEAPYPKVNTTEDFLARFSAADRT